jgi:hypothetical protein
MQKNGHRKEKVIQGLSGDTIRPMAPKQQHQYHHVTEATAAQPSKQKM